LSNLRFLESSAVNWIDREWLYVNLTLERI